MEALTDLVNELRRWIKESRAQPKARLNLSIGLVKLKTQTKGKMTAINITNEQQVPVTLTPKTDKGKPAKVDGIPTWTVQSGDSTVIVSEDGLSAELVSSDTPGDTVILVEADADLGEGVTPISESITLTVSSATATNLGLAVGTPIDKP